MTTRAKRTLASLLLVVYMLVFIAAAAMVLPALGNSRLVMGLATFGLGLVWGVPLIPFLRWANRPDP